MSTASPPAGPSMRQQLDELDALLQRMLTLPVNQTDEGASELPPIRRAIAPDPTPTPPPTQGRGPRMFLLDGSAPVTPPQTPPAAWDPHWNINLNPQQGSSILGPRSPAATAQRQQPENAPPIWRAETVAFAPSQNSPVPQPPLSAPMAPAVRRSNGDAAPREKTPDEGPAPLPLVPLIALNRTFDAVMHCFGPPGQWFCTSAGRNLLGLAGLALLVASAGWFGWSR
jgi:hypothetical protein